MKIVMDHIFGWPHERIVPLLTGEELVDFEELPNVSKRKILGKRREGKKLYKDCEWNVHGQIPKAAQKVVRPEMLTFTEHTVWDDDTCTFVSRIEPHYLKNIIKVETRSQWSVAGTDRTRRHIEMTLEVHIPILGQIVEHTIADHMRKNTEKSAEVLKSVLTRRLGPQTV
jgi:hypothetical protein